MAAKIVRDIEKGMFMIFNIKRCLKQSTVPNVRVMQT
jgi:hypothetical protein